MKIISSKQIIKRLETENPWWEEPYKIPDVFGSWRPRPYLDLFLPLITNRSVKRAVVLMGPRRVGKTVMLHHAIANLLKQEVKPTNIFYVSVDHPIYNNLGLDEIIGYYTKSKKIDITKEETFLFFDEIQYLKEWERYLKSLVDRFPLIKCIVSGSAAAALRLKSSESGAGRFTDFLLPPLTFHEYLYLLGKSDLVNVKYDKEKKEIQFKATDIDELNNNFINYINYGGYPEVIFSKDIQLDPGRFIKSDIIDKVLLRDLPSLYGIQDVQELNSLFTTLAYNTANEISLDGLSQNSGIAKNTIKRYIEYLEAAFLIRIVHRVDRNAKRFKRANFFKVYLTNPSIRSALFSPVDSEDEAIGSLVETAIFSQWFHSKLQLHYARWKNGEVDIVGLDIKEQRARWAVESKWSDSFFENPEKLKSLISFCHTQNLTDALVTTVTKQGTKAQESISIEFVPSSLYCYTLGYNAIKNKKIDPDY